MSEEELRLKIWQDIQQLTVKENWDRRDLTMLLQASKVVELGYDGYCEWLKSMEEKSNSNFIKRMGQEKYDALMLGEESYRQFIKGETNE